MGMKLNVKMNMPLKVNMSRLRWGLAGGLAVLALAATVQSMRTYRAHEMTTGMLAVIALAVLLGVGLVSLGLARLRIGRELMALSRVGAAGAADEGELLQARRSRLEAIRASGARADRDVLAESTRAQEAGRAYIGRYLVATTVLIGLVGTFAGLMQTLGKMAPLFGDKGASDIALLVTPLAGLHVTFGASLVAILSTLALALAQGDLTLCEDQALALLEDRTTHELIPKLWGGDENAGQRAVQTVADLQDVFAASLTKAIETSLAAMSDTARVQSDRADRAARALETVAATMDKELTRLNGTIETSVAQALARQTQALADATLRQGEALAEATKRQAEAMTDANKRQVGALADASKRQAEALAETTVTVGKRLGETASALMAELRAEAQAVRTQANEVAHAALTAAATANEGALARSMDALDQASRGNSAAIEELARSAASAIALSAAQSTSALEQSLRQTTEAAANLIQRATAAVEKGTQDSSQAMTQALQPLLQEEAGRLDGVRAALGDVAGQVEATAARLVELTSALDGLAREQIAAIERSGQAVLTAFDRAVLGGGAALETAAGTLAAAARDLQAGTTTLAPRLAGLTTELGALGREVALLLTSRGPDGDIGAVVLGELDRLGSGMERLSELVRLAADPEGVAGMAAGAAAATTGESERHVLTTDRLDAALEAPLAAPLYVDTDFDSDGADLSGELSAPREVPSSVLDSDVGEDRDGMSAAASTGDGAGMEVGVGDSTQTAGSEVDTTEATVSSPMVSGDHADDESSA